MKKYYPLILFIVLTCIFFYRQIFWGEVLYCCDNLLINIPSKLFLIEELQRRRFPLWNPYLFSGSPFFADLNLALLYPLNILFFFFSSFQALTLGAITNFLIALGGMYVFARSMKRSATAAIVSAIVFGFSGAMVVYTGNVPMLQVAGLLPWVVWSVHRYLLVPSSKTLLIAVALASLQIIAGHPQLTYYTWLLIAGFIIWTLTGSGPVSKQGLTLTRALLLITVLGLLVFLVTSVQVLPFLEFVRLSTRVDRGFAYATFGSVHPLSIVRFVIPNVMGVLRDGTAWARGGSVYGYTGVISLLLALFAVQKNRQARFFFIAAIASLLLAFGSYTPMFRLAYILVPGVASFRSPEHFLLLYTFSVAILAGFGLDEMRRTSRLTGDPPKRLGRLSRRIGGIGGGGIVGGILLLVIAPAFPRLVIQLATLYPTRVLEKLQGFSAETITTIVRLIAQNVLVASAILLAVAFILTKTRRITKLLFIGLVFLELFLYSRNNLLSVPNSEAQQWLTTLMEKARQRGDIDWRQYRLYTDPSAYPYPGKKRFGVFDLDKESAWQAEILRPNLNMAAHFPVIDGYASLIYRDYATYLNSNQPDPTGVTVDDPIGAKKKRLGVGPDGSPRVFLLTDGKETVDGVYIEHYTPNDVLIEVTAKLPSRLVFVDTNYPGWEGFLDGKPTTILSFETVFKSVALPAGMHTISFQYHPKNVRLGLALGGLGLMAIGVLLLRWGSL